MKNPLRITILMDNPRSWFQPYAETLTAQLRERGHEVVRVERPEQLPEGDCAFFLSVESIVKPELLKRHVHNIVIHGSALPKGKGWSPLTWQILEGKSEVTVSLFEAAARVDSGVIYEHETIQFDGSELIDELREKEAQAIVALALRFIDAYPPAHGKEQEGDETFYPRRKPQDSELDPAKTIEENFNLLRVVDNDRYPAFFKHRGHTYILKIYKQDENS